MLEKALTAKSKHCIVIGAGIAGACAADSLARRGWQVTVLDAAAEPASGASGLPVGLFAPYPSADNNFASQITTIGVEFTQLLAARLLINGIDWQRSGLKTRMYGEADVLRADAGWIKPRALVQACLSQPGVTWHGDCAVSSLRHQGDDWEALGDHMQVLARADNIVIAAANQSAALLATVADAPKLTLQAIRGQVTFGSLQDIDVASRSSVPVNGDGSYIETNSEWLVGATYDRINLSLEANITDQVANFERLESLVPETANQLKPVFTRDEVRNWVGIRCASSDRLPIVGEVVQGVWLATALASRGLTFAPLCAELLAMQMSRETTTHLPLNPRLVKALGIQRYVK